ncbi:MAG: tetratricopeptide repeat protein [Paludibacteraceae bacterium]|nr:tetratricopeptide repeat protein [Paludibacteraceae bacterium]
MKTIKILIVAPEELHEEKIQFSSLIEALNESLVSRGIELERVKWDPNTDGSVEDFMEEAGECEMCLTLYWRELAENASEELTAAYQALKAGKNPQNLYVFFKEPTQYISDVLKDFKANFVTNYGHFFCKFENVDTMNLQFILQFESYQHRLASADEDKLIVVKDGKVKVGEKEVVSLDNVPFASMNKEYQRLQTELTDLDQQAAEARKRWKADPDDEDLEDEYLSIKSKRKKVSDEFEKYQNHLYDIALGFAKRAGEAISERMLRAKEAFERGDAVEADNILNMEEMKRQAEQEVKQYEQHRKNLELTIEEFLMKPDIVMANIELSLTERINTACEAYEQALLIANAISFDNAKLAEIYHDYGRMRQFNNNKSEAISLQQNALNIYRQLSKKNPTKYSCEISGILNNIALLQVDLQLYNEAEKNHTESLSIRRLLAKQNPDEFLFKVVDSLNNLANLQRTLNRHAKAEEFLWEAIDILNKFEYDKNDEYWSHLAMTLHNISVLQDDLQRYDEAETNCNEALDIRIKLAEDNPNDLDAFSNMIDTLSNLAILYRNLHRYEEAEEIYQEVLHNRRKLAQENPDIYLPSLSITLYNYALLLDDMSQYDVAEKNFREALNIQRKLLRINPDTYSTSMANMLIRIAIILSKQERYEEAEPLFMESVVIFKRMAEENSEVHEPDYARALYNLANLQRMNHRLEESLKNHLLVLEIHLRLVQINPDIYEEDLAFTYNNLGTLQAEMGQYEDAEKNYLSALEIRERLAEECPEKYIQYLGNTLQFLVKIEKMLNKDEEAEEYYSELISLCLLNDLSRI